MLNSTAPTPEPENSALGFGNSGGSDIEGERKKRPWCDHCQKPWHTKETCWKLHGKPANLKKKPEGNGRAFKTTMEDSQEQPIDSEVSPFTKEQLEHLYKLFKSPQFTVNPSCSLATQGNSYVTALSSLCSFSSNPWIIDSGATDHMKNCSHLFSSYSPCAGNRKIKIADGSFSAIAGIGSIKVSSLITLNNVLHVPKLSCNLLSISKITQDLKCQANFYPTHCEFQELASGRMIGNARENGGLYFFEGPTTSKPVQSSCFEAMSLSRNHEIMLWHYRLGHPSFYYLKRLFPSLFLNKNPSSFQCEICILAKQHRSTYSPQPYKPTKPFFLIHSDVWGPSRTSTLFGKR